MVSFQDFSRISKRNENGLDKQAGMNQTCQMYEMKWFKNKINIAKLRVIQKVIYFKVLFINRVLKYCIE